MTTTETVNHRERSVLRAVHAGRCEVSGTGTVLLVVDGVSCCDQFLGRRLVLAGLIARPGPVAALARLTASGRAVLAADSAPVVRPPSLTAPAGAGARAA